MRARRRVVVITSREERIAGLQGDGDVIADLIREVKGLVDEELLLTTRFAIDDGHHADAGHVHVRPRVEDVNGVGRAETLAQADRTCRSPSPSIARGC